MQSEDRDEKSAKPVSFYQISDERNNNTYPNDHPNAVSTSCHSVESDRKCRTYQITHLLRLLLLLSCRDPDLENRPISSASNA